MTEDLQERIRARMATAARAREETEAVAPTEPAGRYDGVLIKDLPAAVRKTAEELGFYRSRHDEPPRPTADELDLELRALAETSAQCSALYGRWCAGGRVVPLAADGTPLAPPTGDLSQILQWWRPGGPYADRWPGTPCEPGGLYGLALSGAGRDWYREVTTIKFPRAERKSAPEGDYNLLDSVPGAPGVPSWDEDDYVPRPDEQRATCSGELRFVEDRPVAEPRRSIVRTWTGSIRGQAGQEAMAAARGKPLATTSWLVWEWTAGMDLRLGNLRAGVRAVPALPAENSILALNETAYRVYQFPGTTSPPPDWLVAALQKFTR